MSSTLQRIKQYIDYKGLTIQKFEKSIGFSNGAFAIQLKKDKSIGSDKLENILTVYPELNSDWVLTGKGYMIKEFKQNDEKTQVTELSTEYVTGKSLPLIPVSAMAGFGTIDQTILERDCERFVVPNFKTADFVITVSGNSMQPKYNSGDVVACKKLNINDVFFQWGKVYVLDTDQGALLKRIRKGKDDDHILVVSDNPEYDPFDLHKSKLNAIAIVTGVIRLV
ncbi:S24 family peptidase [Flavobacterium alkalisoli]|uniref:S24 family peptidase n=1 Tax=Flavobacterium alkalisoli TaxID=2602769 RepID=UPI003A8F05C0